MSTETTSTQDQPVTAAGVVSTAWLAILRDAERVGDRVEDVYAAELMLLRRIASASSDLMKAEHWPEFCEACGGMAALKSAHYDAVAAWEKWHSDSEG